MRDRDVEGLWGIINEVVCSASVPFEKQPADAPCEDAREIYLRQQLWGLREQEPAPVYRTDGLQAHLTAWRQRARVQSLQRALRNARAAQRRRRRAVGCVGS